SQGTYDNTTHLWSVGTLPAGSTVTLSLTVKVTSGGTQVNYAEVYEAKPEDTDSTPKNGSTEEDDDATATFTVSSTVGDFVWRDINVNGIQDAGEPGIEGFLVELLNGSTLAIEQTTTTDADGYYLFTDVNPGTYTLRFTPPVTMPGQVFTTKNASGSTAANDSNADASGITDSFTLVTGASNLTIDAGVKPVDLELQKFVDWKIANDMEDPGEELYSIGNQKSFVFTIRVANAAGMSTASGVVVKDVIPAGMTYVDSPASYVASQGTFTGGLWTVGTLAGGAAATLKVTVTADSSSATPPPLGGTPNSIGSLFEGGDGNLVVATGDENLYYDWANKAPNLVKKNDQPDNDDDIFKTGSKEDDPVPDVTFDQSAPNKDNLLRFYTAHDQLGSSAFLYLAWIRSDTTGDANIDFELNQSRTISSNTVTPIRTVGDLLLSYEFSQGGGQPNIYVRLWQAASGSQPEQWSTRTELNSSIAMAAVNTTIVLDLDGTTTLTAGQFGEAAINLTKAFQSIKPNQCQNYASAFVKTRASTSFQAELKDFIAPAEVQVTNCVTVRNVAEVTRPLVSDYDSTPDNGAQPIPEDDWDSLLVEIYPLGTTTGGQSSDGGSGGAALSSFLGGSDSAPISLMFIAPNATGSLSFLDGGTNLNGTVLASSDATAVDAAFCCVIESEGSNDLWNSLSSNLASSFDKSSRDSADRLFDRLDHADLVEWLN
ncbi:MAG: SdrD B-like domain-containing protein, partial [Planctomycetota bacterium]